jgi:hypothetical protein
MAAGRPSILLRVAAGPRIGFGHLVRARTLARVLDADVRLSVRGTPATIERARSLGLALAHPSVARALDADGPFDLVVVDDPSLRPAREAVDAARAAKTRVAVIRDAGRPAVRADLARLATDGRGPGRAMRCWIRTSWRGAVRVAPPPTTVAPRAC